MFLVTELLHVYANPLSAIAVGIISSALVVWQTTKGVDKLESKIDGVKADLGAEIQGLRGEIQVCQAMVLESGQHTMKAIDGNKQPMREWLKRLERCKQSGGEDCGPNQKARGAQQGLKAGVEGTTRGG